ncbi:MAG: hypothetical protein HUK22_02225, partial [Thermoguttaceae bacterium]|nr:hypothetical protein [Thermoguttaceae bacterium]
LSVRRVVPAVGVAKDEWGFPPFNDRSDPTTEFWYSERMRAAYAKNFGGELLFDLFLASRPQFGMEALRMAIFNNYRRFCAERVVEYENQNYALTKEIWGPDAFVGVHCTWYPWPNVLEMRKNGIMWWKAPRDFAQTDEYTPFCCRISMAKATGPEGSRWINMFYARQAPPYIWEHWTAAAAGGRVHVHGIYPYDENSPKHPVESRMLPIIADGGVARIRSKIRIVNLISNAPLEAPVAVVFGRRGVMNPFLPEYRQVGVDVCDRFSTQGFPADLIPSDEIESTSPSGAARWRLSDDGFLQYGPQKYSVVVLFGDNTFDSSDFRELRRLAWAKNWKTRVLTLPATATQQERDDFVAAAIAELKKAQIAPQTPWERDSLHFDNDVEISARPPRVAESRFTDGTIQWVAAESDAGDRIELNEERVSLDGDAETAPITAVANGIFAIRFDADGALEAVAGAELTKLSVGDFAFELTAEEIGDEPIDVAIWKDATGAWRGVFQRATNDLPPTLAALDVEWLYLATGR